MNFNKFLKLKRNKLLLGLIFGCLFALIDSLIFLLGEENLDSQLHKYTQLDSIERSLIIGGGSAAVAIIISEFIDKYVFINVDFHRNVYLDFLGIIMGTSIVTLIYHYAKEYNNIFN
jgi:predicted neutral ceramidase superfamily lipid hydrolase